MYKAKRSRVFITAASLAAVLCLAAAVQAQQPPASGARTYSVRNFGAVGDGETLDSPAINRAIEQCAQAGGGTVSFPAGTYLSGSIRMKSNINLFLDAGAIIRGAPQDMNAYDPAEHFEGKAYQDGGHTYFHNSLIWGENLTNISITGPGMIHGGGLTSGDGPLDRISGFSSGGRSGAAVDANSGGRGRRSGAASDANSAGRRGRGGRSSAPVDLNAPVRLGNKAIAFKLCKQVLIRDITIAHGGHFAIITTGCDGLTVDNVTMDTNRDGIDIDCCRNTTVSNCRINSPGDDALCPKSSFALGRNVITENLTITNCQVSGFVEGTLLDGTMKPRGNGNGRIKFGTEANGGFRNVTVSNCTFRSCRGLALEEVDGGILENITINNITMMDVPSYAIYITTGKRNRGPDVNTPSQLRNIIISNVIATGVSRNSGIQIMGMPDHPVEGVRLDNIQLEFQGGGTAGDAALVPPELNTGYPEPRGIMPGYGVFARHVRNLELSNIRLSVDKDDLRPPMVCVDVNGLEIDNFKAQLANGVTGGRFEQVKGLVIRNSPVLDARQEVK